MQTTAQPINHEYTEREAAELLRVSVKTLRRERADGAIAFVQRRRRILYPATAIADYQTGQVIRNRPAHNDNWQVRSTPSRKWDANAAMRRALTIK